MLRSLGVIVLQVLISLFLVASLTPLVLVSVPALQEGRAGIGVVVAGAIIMFGLLRAVWPRPRV